MSFSGIIRTDVLVIGGGAAGLAAAAAAADVGVRVTLVESERLGGILCRCIHDGFGLTAYGESLTGPEYASREIAKLEGRRNVDIIIGTVTSLSSALSAEVVSEGGCFEVRARAVVLATGSRERAFGSLDIGGTRPAGIFTAGAAQRIVNEDGMSVGRRIVILGSGDIGLIMARRFTLEGAKVEAVLEIAPRPGGLARNVAQCLGDFRIPLELSTTVAEVYGYPRIEGVVAAKVDEDRRIIPGTERRIACDALVLSVGLIPVVNLLPGAAIDPATGGAEVDSRFMTTAAGVFSCGNALHINDLADNVSAEGAAAGRSAALFAIGRLEKADTVTVTAGENVASVVPRRIAVGEEATVWVRLKKSLVGTLAFRDADGYNVKDKKGAMAPNEMIAVTLAPSQTTRPLTVSAEEA